MVVLAPTVPPTQPAATPTPPDPVQALQKALDLLRSGRCDRAAPLLAHAAQTHAVLADYALFYRGQCAAQSQESDVAQRSWKRLLERYPDSLLVPQAQLGLGALLRESSRYEDAVTALRAAAQSEDRKTAPRARLLLAGINIERGSYDRAYADLTALREAKPGSPIAQQAKQQLRSIRNHVLHQLERDSHSPDGVRLLLREGDTASAAAVVAKLLRTAEDTDVPQLLMLRARVEKAAGDSAAQLSTYREIYTRHPGSATAAEARYQEGRHHWNRDNDEQATRIFRTFLERHPRHKRAATARYALARIAQASRRFDAASDLFRTVIRRHPRSSLAQEAKRQIGWIRYRQGRYAEAARDWGKYTRGRSISRATALHYWKARALERARQTAEARRGYDLIVERVPDSNYATLARKRLGLADQRPPVLALSPSRSFPDLPTAHRFHPRLTRAQALHAIDQPTLARRELRAFERSLSSPGDTRRFLLRAYSAVDGYRRAIQLSHRDDIEREDVLYPLAFANTVGRAAAKYDIDPLLALSLMRQESMFDPEALSPANARGLMQLLPSTAAATARAISFQGKIDLFDPETNIELGTAHLAELASLYSGDPIRMLAAYNAGRAAVAKWDRRFGDFPADEYVEAITYRETRDYVKKVLRNYARYRKILAARTLTGSVHRNLAAHTNENS